MRGRLQDENLRKLKKNIPQKFYDKIMYSIQFIVREVEQVEQIYLFGSCARYNPKWDSDVDLAIITGDALTDHYLRGYVIDSLDVESSKGVRADVIFRTPEMRDEEDAYNRQVIDVHMIVERLLKGVLENVDLQDNCYKSELLRSHNLRRIGQEINNHLVHHKLSC